MRAAFCAAAVGLVWTALAIGADGTAPARPTVVGWRLDGTGHYPNTNPPTDIQPPGTQERRAAAGDIGVASTCRVSNVIVPGRARKEPVCPQVYWRIIAKIRDRGNSSSLGDPRTPEKTDLVPRRGVW